MKVNKILAFVIAFAMVMSFMVIPVNAAPVNLAGEITGITDNVVSHTATVKASDDAAAPNWSVVYANATFADGVVTVTRLPASGQYYSQSGLRLYNAPLESGKSYYIEAYFKGEGTIPAKYSDQIRFYLANDNGADNKASVTGLSASGETASITSYIYPSEKQGQWIKSSGYFTVPRNESGTAEKGLTLGIKAGANSNAQTYGYSVKDIKLYEVKTFTGVAEANGTGAVFTFANNVKTADASNFAVTSTDANAATPSVSLVTEGNTCTVSLSDYSWETDYTITASGITDMFSQTLSAPVSVTVTTPKKPANIAGEITGIANNVISHTAVVKAGADAAAPNWVVTSGATATYQDGVISVTARKSTDASSGLQLSNLGVESGKTYYISAQFRCDTAPTTGSKNARFYMTNITKDENKAVIPTGITGQTETDSITKNFDIVTNTGWQTVDGIFTVGADDGTKELGLNLGIKVGQNSNSDTFLYSVKNIVVYELTVLDINGNYMAKVVKGDNDTVTLYITGPTSVVYLAAASYEGTALTDVQFAQRNITSIVRTVSVKAGDNYKIMVWDSNMNPLCNAFMGSDI